MTMRTRLRILLALAAAAVILESCTTLDLHRLSDSRPHHVQALAWFDRIVLQWTPVAGALSYSVQIGTSDSPFVPATTKISSESTLGIFPADLGAGPNFFAVAAVFSSGTGPYSRPISSELLTPARVLGPAIFRAQGGMSGDHFGSVVAGVGDVDLDGRPDVLIASHGPSNSTAHLYLGSNGGLAAMARELPAYPPGFYDRFTAIGNADSTAPIDSFPEIVVSGIGNGSVPGQAIVVDWRPGSRTLEPLAGTTNGTVPQDQFGRSVAALGDLNGDGLGDFAVGEPAEVGVNGTGRVIGFYGASLAPATSFELRAPGPGTGFGRSIAGIRRPVGSARDLVVGEPRLGSGVGRIDRYRYYNPPGGSFGFLGSVDGDPAHPGFGAVVAAAGDVDGDGVEDLLVGAIPANDALAPVAYLYLGLSTNEAWSWVGATPDPLALPDATRLQLVAAGDVNGDGFDDVLVGEPVAGNGRVSLFLGTSGGLRPNAAWVLDGEQIGERFGASVASAGDVDEDGLPDIAVGSPGFANDRGRVRVFRGSPLTGPASPVVDVGEMPVGHAGVGVPMRFASFFDPLDPHGVGSLTCKIYWGEREDADGIYTVPDCVAASFVIGPAANFTYSRPGTFAVRLRIETADGRVGEATTEAVVIP